MSSIAYVNGRYVPLREAFVHIEDRGYQLADGVQVRGARLENGLLHIDLVREIPEAKKPRRVAINGDNGKVEVLKGKSAA